MIRILLTVVFLAWSGLIRAGEAKVLIWGAFAFLFWRMIYETDHWDCSVN